MHAAINVWKVKPGQIDAAIAADRAGGTAPGAIERFTAVDRENNTMTIVAFWDDEAGANAWPASEHGRAYQAAVAPHVDGAVQRKVAPAEKISADAGARSHLAMSERTLKPGMIDAAVGDRKQLEPVNRDIWIVIDRENDTVTTLAIAGSAEHIEHWPRSEHGAAVAGAFEPHLAAERRSVHEVVFSDSGR